MGSSVVRLSNVVVRLSNSDVRLSNAVVFPMQDPPEAYHRQTPLIKEVWHYHLQNHHQQDLMQYFLTSISNGFQIGFHGTSLQSAKKNLVSVATHPEVVEDYLKHELSLGRMSGPYPISLCPEVHVNRFGVIPKSHQPGKWHLITDLSHLQGKSVNDGISSHLCSLIYVTIDDAIANIVLRTRTRLHAGKSRHKKCASGTSN